MKPDTKQQVLLALYTEYQRDLPNFNHISAASLGMEVETFNFALKKLQDEELIGDVHLIWGDENESVPMGVILSLCKLTRLGIEYVEQNFGLVNGWPAAQKVMILGSKYQEWGLQELFRLYSRVQAEL
ncbi:hypothetical protein [Paradesulfitobacterium ferrireducens]|uniref:hypothetical protein n=1 Tax=Paradesulfitobacterium ferrireducens TaxID=2816476 RepID=UPI001A8F1362|nr:hypothetical protein [Paradesulfitobacterium ferrireducens]